MSRFKVNQTNIIKLIRSLFPEHAVVSLEPGPLSARGISDLVISYGGVDYFCEVKACNTRIDLLQLHFLQHRNHPILLEVQHEHVNFYVRNSCMPVTLHFLPGLLSKKTGRLYGFSVEPIEYLFESYLKTGTAC